MYVISISMCYYHRTCRLLALECVIIHRTCRLLVLARVLLSSYMYVCYYFPRVCVINACVCVVTIAHVCASVCVLLMLICYYFSRVCYYHRTCIVCVINASVCY